MKRCVLVRFVAIPLSLVLAGCVSGKPDSPAPAEPPSAEDPPLKPDPLGRKLLEQMPTATQVRECARRVPTTLDLGGWELRQWPVRDAEENCSFELLYAVRGEEVRFIGRRDELAELVERWRSADDVAELAALIERELKAGIDLWDGLTYPRDEEEASPAEARSGLRTKTIHQGDSCIVERPLFQSAFGRDRVVQVREIFAPHSYASEIVQVVEEIPNHTAYAWSADQLKARGAPVDTKLRPGGWQLFVALTNPDGMECPASSSIYAVKGDTVREIRRMDELAALAGPLDSGADAVELCQIPARVGAKVLLAFQEDHGWVPDGEWEYLPAEAEKYREPTVESVPGGWAVERLACQYAGFGQLVRVVVIRETIVGGRVRTEVVRVVRNLIPMLRTYE